MVDKLTRAARHTALAAAILCLLPTVSRAQDDEVALTTPASRDAVFAAMNAAAADMHTTGEGNVADGRWRSASVHRTQALFLEDPRAGSHTGQRVTLDFVAFITARLTNAAPDTLRVTFRAQVSANVPLSPSDLSAIARAFLLEFAQRTRRHIAPPAP